MRDYLTVHVLDTAMGTGAEGLGVRLSRDGKLLGTFVTDADGRSERPLLEGTDLQPGVYEIAFDIEAWRTGKGDPGFYDRITIRFRVPPSPGHVHIPLLLSPYGYSTYRGN